MKVTLLIIALIFLSSLPIFAEEENEKLEILKCLPDGKISRISYINYEKLNEMLDKNFNGMEIDAKDSPFMTPLSPAFAENVKWKVSAYYKGAIKASIYKIEGLKDLVKDAKDRKRLNEVNIYYKARQLLYIGDPEEYLATDTLPEKYLLALPFDKDTLFVCNNFDFFGKLLDAAKKKTALAMDSPYYASIFNLNQIDARMETPCFRVKYGYGPKSEEIAKMDQKIRGETEGQENYRSLSAKGKIYRLTIPMGEANSFGLQNYELIVLFFGSKGLSHVSSDHDFYELSNMFGMVNKTYVLEKFTKHRKEKRLP